jgi:nicotinamidase-related amidase
MIRFIGRPSRKPQSPLAGTDREAADKDYHLSVLSDCCADLDKEVHTVLLSKVFPRQAEVLTAAEWAARIK